MLVVVKVVVMAVVLAVFSFKLQIVVVLWCALCIDCFGSVGWASGKTSYTGLPSFFWKRGRFVIVICSMQAYGIKIIVYKLAISLL